MRRLDAIGDRDLRSTLIFVRAQRNPVTAEDVAGMEEIHRNVARARLERLVQAGLLIPSFERRTGRSGPGAGRPAKTYRVAPELRPIEFPPRSYDRLIALLAEALPERVRADRLHEIGIAFGGQLGRRARLRTGNSVRRALDRVCSALGRLGFQSSISEVEADRAVITTPTCPLRPLVRSNARLAALDRGMWTGLAASALDSETATVRCTTTAGCHDDRGDCQIHLTFDSS